MTKGFSLPAQLTEELVPLGWRAALRSRLDQLEYSASPSDLHIARVIGVQRTGLEVAPAVGAGNTHVPLSGRWFQGDALSRPTVGDWVVIDKPTGSLLDMLPRLSVIKRMSPSGGAQLIAANVDTAFIVSACNADYSPARIERYLSVIMQADIEPVIILTKADLIGDADAFRDSVSREFPAVQSLVLNALDSEAVARLHGWCGQGQTIALLGSSGVGKSTLVNSLVGAQMQLTQAVREGDEKGRHTTTNRSLHLLPQGGVILDSPGMRELQIADADAGLGQVFEDIEDLAAHCKFNDCGHISEPGCAVLAAIASGRVDARRVQHYRALRQEEVANRGALTERRTRSRSPTKDRANRDGLSESMGDGLDES